MDALATRHMSTLTDAIAERDRRPDRRTELQDAYEEIAALRAEKVEMAVYLKRLSKWLWTAYWSHDWPNPLRKKVEAIAKNVDDNIDRLLTQASAT